jgi:hypothetical protein
MHYMLRYRRTVCSRIQHDEARIDGRALSIMCPVYGVCVTTKTFFLFEKVDFVLCVAKGVQGAHARYATTDYGNPLLLHMAVHGLLAYVCGEYTDDFKTGAKWTHQQ